MGYDVEQAMIVKGAVSSFADLLKNKGLDLRKLVDQSEFDGDISDALSIDILNFGLIIMREGAKINDDVQDCIRQSLGCDLSKVQIRKMKKHLDSQEYDNLSLVLPLFVTLDKAAGLNGQLIVCYLKILAIFCLSLLQAKGAELSEMIEYHTCMMACKCAAEEELGIDIEFEPFEDVSGEQMDIVRSAISLKDTLSTTRNPALASLRKRMGLQPEDEEEAEEEERDEPDSEGEEPVAIFEVGDEDPETNDEDADISGVEKLNALIGLSEVKDQIRNMMNIIRVSNKCNEYGIKRPKVGMNTVFTGNPGTGKTTVARILGQIYKEEGILPKGQFVEVSRADIVGKYVGHTAPMVKSAFEKAKGGILYIDEAYSLVGDNDSFGQEAVDTIVKLMEENREDTMVIVAGYPAQMREFLDSNPGLRSRFPKTICFKDYTSAELLEIFQLFCSEYGIKCSRAVLKSIEEYLETEVHDHRKSFGNARGVRNLFEAMLENQANRLVESGKIDPKGVSTFIKKDIPVRNIIKDIGNVDPKLLNFSSKQDPKHK